MGADYGLDAGQVADADLVGLIDQHENGAEQLLFEQFLEWAFVVTESRIGRPLPRQRGRIGREPAGQHRRCVDDPREHHRP